jgi:chemotaxis regulatin CheY-phosphate phosphatase CheZ
VDPNLAAALTHVAREMEKLSERQEQRNLEKIQGLTNEVRTLATSIKDLFKEVVAQREDDSPDQTAVVLTRAVQSSMEQLTARFDTAAAGLTDAVNQGIPVANALEEASHAMSQHLDSFLAADLSGAVDRLQRSIDQNSEKVDKRDAEILEGLSAQASATSEQFQQVRDELLNNRQAIQDLPGQLAPTITSGILESQKEIPERVANAVGSRLEQSFGTSISSFADASMAARAEDAQRVSELLRKASEASELLKQIEQKLGSNGHGPALAQTIEKLDGTIERLEGALSSGTGNHGGLRGLLRRR